MSTNTANPAHQSSSNRSPFPNQFQPELRGSAFIGNPTPSSSSGNWAAEGQTPVTQQKRSTRRTPEPGSEIASWLPEGWLVEERWRTSGATAGSVDKYYFDPKTGRRFRSKKEVQYYLETGTVRQKKRGAENTDNPSEVPGSQKKKSGVENPSLFEPSDVPEAVEWSLTNAAEDDWTPSIRGNEVPKQETEGWKIEFAVRTANSCSKNWFWEGV